MKKGRFMIIYLVIFLALFINPKSLFVNPAFAAESSPSSSIREKLEALKREVASKAALLKKEVTKKLNNKAYFGVVNIKDGEKLTIKKGDLSKSIQTNEYTIFESKSKKTGLKDIVKDDFIVALGDVDDSNVLTAKKIVKLTKNPIVKRETIWGQVKKITDSNILVKDSKGKELKIAFSTKQSFSTSKTEFKLGDQEASSLDLKENRVIIAVGEMRDNLVADFIYLIPVNGILKQEKAKVASPSAKASPSASASARPKKTN